MRSSLFCCCVSYLPVILLSLSSGVFSTKRRKCSFTLEGKSGTFTSPGFPDSPGLDLPYTSCEWSIKVSKGKGIQIRFGEFDIQGRRDDCDRGSIDIYEGVGKMKSQMDTLCPGDIGDTLMIRNNTATVQFKWPRDFQGQGFLISYIEVNPGENLGQFVPCSFAGSKTQTEDKTQEYSVICPAGCANFTGFKVWGGTCFDFSCQTTRKYKMGSNICRAAVHVGVISDKTGGHVKVATTLGQASLYTKIRSNGISSEIKHSSSFTNYAISFPDSRQCDEILEYKAEQTSASSVRPDEPYEDKPNQFAPYRANFKDVYFSWQPANYSRGQWWQVDLLKIFNVTGISINGKPQWILKYTVKWSTNGVNFHDYVEDGTNYPKVFLGCTNSYTAAMNNFVSPRMLARYVRIYPFSDSDTRKYAANVQIRGCKIEDDKIPVIEPVVTTSTKAVKKSTTLKSTTKSTTLPKLTSTTFSKASATTTVQNKKPKEDNNDPKKNDTTDNGDDDNTSSITDSNVIIIVITLAVLMILLTLTFLCLIRKQSKNARMSDHLNGYQTNLGGQVRYVAQTNGNSVKSTMFGGRTMNTNVAHTMNTTLSSNNSQVGGGRIEYQNSHYHDGVGYMHSNSRAPLMFNHDNVPTTSTSGIAVRQPMRHSSKPKVHNGVGAARQDSSSFGSVLEEDHEYQVIPDVPPVPPKAHGTSTTHSSTYPKNPPSLPHPNRNRSNMHGNSKQRAGTFPHNNQVTFGHDQNYAVPLSSSSGPTFESFTGPRQSNVNNHQRPGYHQSVSMTSSNNSYLQPVQPHVLPKQNFQLQDSAAVPLLRQSSGNSNNVDSAFYPSNAPEGRHFYPSERNRRGDQSYDVPAQPAVLSTFGDYRGSPNYQHPTNKSFSTMSTVLASESTNSSLDRDVPPEPNVPFNSFNTPRVSRSDSAAKQRNGYDHLSRDQFRSNLRSTPEDHVLQSNQSVSPTHANNHSKHTYHQLDLNARA